MTTDRDELLAGIVFTVSTTDLGDSLVRLSARVEGFKMVTDERLRSIDKCQSVQAASIEALERRVNELGTSAGAANPEAEIASISQSVVQTAQVTRPVELRCDARAVGSRSLSPDDEPKVPNKPCEMAWDGRGIFSMYMKDGREWQDYALALERLVAWQRKKLEQSVSRSAAINAMGCWAKDRVRAVGNREPAHKLISHCFDAAIKAETAKETK